MARRQSTYIKIDKEEIKRKLQIELLDFVDTDLAKAIVILRALGLSSNEVESLFHFNDVAQEYLINDVDHLNELFEKYDTTTRETEQEKMLRLSRSALNLKARILEDESQPMSLRNTVATEIYEQVYGKARQKLETVNYNLDVSSNIDKLKAGIETIYSRLVETATKKGLLTDETDTGDIIET